MARTRKTTSGDSPAVSAQRCPHFGPCGGCDLLDVPYRDEQHEKELALARLAEATAALKDARLLPILAAAEPLYYRTALKVPFGTSSDGATAGFYRRGSHRVVNLETCLIQHPALTHLLVTTRELVRRIGVPVYQEHVHKGILRHLVARIGAGTGDMLVGLVVRRHNAPQVRRLAQVLYQTFERQGLVGIVENVNPERTNVLLGRVTRRLQGDMFLDEEVDGLRFRTSLASFAQSNAAQASVLFAEVMRMAGDVAGKRVADVYAGYGPLALRFAKAGAHVVAIERSRTAVRDGIHSARLSKLEEQVRFIAADAEHGLRSLTEPPDLVVVDPPRRGLTPPLIAALAESPARRLIYVSCNPLTLARDADLLAPAWRATELRAVDLFPRTKHLEAVALFER